jgi:hypothetical protein
MTPIEQAIEALESARCVNYNGSDCIRARHPIPCRRCAALARLRACTVVEGRAEQTPQVFGCDGLLWDFYHGASKGGRPAYLVTEGES